MVDMRKTRVYLAGPMRGYKYYNFPAFHKIANELRTFWAEVVSPAELDVLDGYDPMTLPEDNDWNKFPSDFPMTFDECVSRDIQHLLTCDTIYLLKGWEESKGARAELAVAKWRGLDVLYEEDNLADLISKDAVHIEEIADKGVLCDPKQTNPKQELGDDKTPLYLFPATARAAGAYAMAEGLLKYGRSNYRVAGVRASTYYSALNRHMDKWFEGEDIDPDSSLPHLWKALACVTILIDAEEAGMLTDDRMVKGGYLDMCKRVEKKMQELRTKIGRRSPKHYTIQDNTSPKRVKAWE